MKKNNDFELEELRKEFEKLDLAEVDIFWIRPEYLREILLGLQKCLARCPYVNSKGIILRGRRPEDSPVEKGNILQPTIALVQPIRTEFGRLMVEIVFEDCFKSKKLSRWLKKDYKKKFVVFSNIEGDISHEFGHILQLYFLNYNFFQNSLY